MRGVPLSEKGKPVVGISLAANKQKPYVISSCERRKEEEEKKEKKEEDEKSQEE